MTAKLPIAVVLGLAMLLAGGFIWYSWDRSIYAPGYSEDAFKRVRPGMHESEVRAFLCQPILEQEDVFPETWYYEEFRPSRNQRTFRLLDAAKSVTFDSSGTMVKLRGLEARALGGATSKAKVREALGQPKKVIQARTRCAHYSSPQDFGRYRARIVAYAPDGRVAEVFAYDTYD